MSSGLDSSAEYTVKVLQERLDAAEHEGKKLFRNLETFGFKNGGTSRQSLVKDSNMEKGKFKRAGIKNGDKIANEKMSKKEADYKLIEKRVCNMEDSLLSLHSCVGSLKSEEHKAKEMQSKESRSINEAMLSNMEKIKMEYNKTKCEVRRLQDKNAKMRKKNGILDSAVKEKQNKIQELESQLMQLATEKEKVFLKAEEAASLINQATTQKVSAEEAHVLALEKIQDLEHNLETERQLVVQLSNNNKTLQRELSIAKDALLHEQDERLQLQSVVSQHGLNSERVNIEFSELARQKKVLQDELERIQKENIILQDQLSVVNRAHEEIKKSQKQLADENAKLQEGLRMAATDNKALISQQKDLIQREREKINMKMKEQDKVLMEAKEAVVKELQKEKSNYESISRESNERKKRIVDLEMEIRSNNDKLKATEAREKEAVEQLRLRFEEAKAEKENIFAKMSADLNRQRDEMVLSNKQRDDALTLVRELEIEKERITVVTDHLREENKVLKERTTAAEQQKMTQVHIERVMSELSQAKNKLAYEKGALETEVDQLKASLMSLAGAKEENNILRQKNAALQNQYNKVVSELQNMRRGFQQMELELKKAYTSNDTKDTELRALVHSREEALQEAQKLLLHIESIEKRYSEKVTALETSLQNSQQESRKMVSNLEGMASTHSQVQGVIEELQTELGRKDSKIQLLESERLASHQSVQAMQQEMTLLQERLNSLEQTESVEATDLKKQLARSKKEEKRLSRNYQTVLKQRDGLQEQLINLNMEKEKVQESVNILKKESLERFKKLEQQNQLANREVAKDYEKLKKLLTSAEEEAEKKNQEVNKMKEQLQTLRTEMEHLAVTHAMLEGKKQSDLEKVNDFVRQVQELQSEIEVLARSRDSALQRLRQKEEDLNKETQKRLDCEDLCKQLEQRLFEASKQNDKISSSLKESENWFKRKVDHLEQEMAASKKERNFLEQTTMEQQQLVEREKEKSGLVAENAKQLIRASRVAVNRLAGRVSENDWETKGLKDLMNKENHRAIRAVQKYEKLLEASTRRVEELAQELDRAHEKARKKI